MFLALKTISYKETGLAEANVAPKQYFYNNFHLKIDKIFAPYNIIVKTIENDKITETGKLTFFNRIVLIFLLSTSKLYQLK